MTRLLFALCLAPIAALAAERAPDTPFRQEIAAVRTYPEHALGDALCVAFDGSSVYVGFAEGALAYELVLGQWRNLAEAGLPAMPVFAILAHEGAVYLAHGLGLSRLQEGRLESILESERPLSALAVHDGELLAAGPAGVWRVHEGEARRVETGQLARGVRALAIDAAGRPWLATGLGLYRLDDGGSFQLYQAPDEILSSYVHDVFALPDGRVWAGGLGGLSIYEEGAWKERVTPAEGLPNAWVNALARDTEGGVWVGTELGAARFDGARWSARHSRRWLADDHVVDIAPDDHGGVWIATRGGLSHIAAKTMTLAEKAAYFEQVTDERHIREPWLVEKIRLARPHDLSEWKPEDDDNDGEYTSQYLAAQAYRWQATGDEDARQKARRAWEALVFLQQVTGTSGFIARTVIPADWEPLHDPNRDYPEAERKRLEVEEPRYKAVEQRWRPSADGRWKWKGDTSSDEYTGHYHSFGVYYDLVATEEEKPAIRDHVARVTDHLIANDFNLHDIDDQPTRWGVWSPRQLNHDPEWRAERGINSAEMLSYLLTAWHVTGEERFLRHYRDLIENHNYAENARHAKTYAPAWITHIDDCLLVMAYRALILYEKDPELSALYRASMDDWYKGIRHEQNPWFNYVYGQLTGAEPQREDSLFFLRDTPIDLIAYTVSQLGREDLQLVRSPILEVIQTNRLIPPSERATVRWDKNPWQAVDGYGGISEWAPTFWLMAYWQGRHAGFIAANQ